MKLIQRRFRNRAAPGIAQLKPKGLSLKGEPGQHGLPALHAAFLDRVQLSILHEASAGGTEYANTQTAQLQRGMNKFSYYIQKIAVS